MNERIRVRTTEATRVKVEPKNEREKRKKRRSRPLAAAALACLGMACVLRWQGGMLVLLFRMTRSPPPPPRVYSVKPDQQRVLQITPKHDKPPPMPRQPPMPIRNATIVASIFGEMGNILSVIGSAVVIQGMISKNTLLDDSLPPLKVRIAIHYKVKARQTIQALRNVQRCFPEVGKYPRSGQTFKFLQETQEQWLGADLAKPLQIDADTDIAEFDGVISSLRHVHDTETFQKILSHPSKPDIVPFIGIQKFLSFPMVDQHYDHIRRFFRFNDKACCRLVPDPDESVLHLRNFVVEMKGRTNERGFQELSPAKTANELFSHLQPGDKVAITTRFVDHVQPYVTALQQRGLVVRVIANQTSMEDFCFLRRTKKELVGTKVSSFTRWAAFLGDMSKVTLYSIHSPDTIRLYGEDYLNPYQWTNPILKDKISLQIYKSEAQDALEAQQASVPS